MDTTPSQATTQMQWRIKRFVQAPYKADQKASGNMTRIEQLSI